MSTSVRPETARTIRRSDVVWELGDEDRAELQTTQRDGQERAKEVAEQILGFLASGRFRVPMLPEAALDAITLANDPKTGARELERVISADPVLAARVFTIANSSVYGIHVRTLTQAVQRLGTGTIRDILYQAVADAHIFRGRDGAALTHERDHAVGVAIATRYIAQQIGLESGYGFVCGLLHDLGRTVLMEFLHQHPPAGATREDLELVVRQLHTFVGGRVSTLWGLPKLVTEAARRHHVYRDWAGPSGGYSQIGNMVAVADRLAYHLAWGRLVQPVNLRSDRTYYDLGLDPERVLGLVKALEADPARNARGT